MPKKNYVPDEIAFRTKPQIALEQVDRALGNGICVSAWTFDEFYGRDRKFLDGLEARSQAFVGEIPSDFHGWTQKPTVLRTGPKKPAKRGRKKRFPRVARRRPSCEVRNLLKYSPVFREQSWQRYRIKDSNRGPVVWEVKWAVLWRKNAAGLPTRRHCLIVARNVLSGEVKYFLSNRVPGERNPVTGQSVTLRRLLRVAFGRWSIESCFREGKEELGLDHYEVRGWRCVHRHFYVTQLSHLFCANATGVRRDPERQGRPALRGASSQRHERVAGLGRFAAQVHTSAFRKRTGEATILPAAQQAGPRVACEDATRPAGRVGNRPRQDQIMPRPQGQPMTHGMFATPLTANDGAKVGAAQLVAIGVGLEAQQGDDLPLHGRQFRDHHLRIAIADL